MTSNRKRKKEAERRGLSERELAMAEVVEEILEHLRWQSVLGYSNQYLVSQHLQVDKAERDKILEAATRAVEKDGKIADWRERLARIKNEIVEAQRAIGRAETEMQAGEGPRGDAE